MEENNTPLRRSKKTITEETTKGYSRTKAKKEKKMADEEAKSKKLAKRLDITIATLTVALILVFLFMRFVNF